MHGIAPHRVLPVLLAALLVLACGGADSPPGGSPDADVQAVDVQTYTVRGVVRGLGDSTGTVREIFVRHEAVPDFVDMSGEVVGMEAMTMPFPITDPRLLEGIAVGDTIEFDFRVSWKGSPPLEVLRIEKIQPSTSPKETAPEETEPGDGP